MLFLHFGTSFTTSLQDNNGTLKDRDIIWLISLSVALRSIFVKYNENSPLSFSVCGDVLQAISLVPSKRSGEHVEATGVECRYGATWSGFRTISASVWAISATVHFRSFNSSSMDGDGSVLVATSVFARSRILQNNTMHALQIQIILVDKAHRSFSVTPTQLAWNDCAHCPSHTVYRSESILMTREHLPQFLVIFAQNEWLMLLIWRHNLRRNIGFYDDVTGEFRQRLVRQVLLLKNSPVLRF